jgi:hypothetical protein
VAGVVLGLLELLRAPQGVRRAGALGAVCSIHNCIACCSP